MPLPEKDEMFLTKGKMFEDIMVSLGGRIAEEIIFDDITTVFSNFAQLLLFSYPLSRFFGLRIVSIKERLKLDTVDLFLLQKELRTLVDYGYQSISEGRKKSAVFFRNAPCF